ncbi:hypothetical protein PIB30_081581 [Stylosanthes scabra]|uniref:Uncharacterized protein n=1 Tax=Stylosanthes scabra TaxID=79078 RepID=A0ABU6XQ94_9FABA|nr:hypothetical protein [Stylosanthes scabra]
MTSSLPPTGAPPKPRNLRQCRGGVKRGRFRYHNPDGTVRSRGTRCDLPCDRTVTKIEALTSHSRGRAVRPFGLTGIGRMHPETLLGTLEAAR